MRVSVVLALVLLGACAGSPARMAFENLDAETAAEYSDAQLCGYLVTSDKHDAIVRAELERRGLFAERDWLAIEQHKIFIGMSALAFHCSWPRPDVLGNWYDLISTKEGPWGIRVRYKYSMTGNVYSYTPSCPSPVAVYFENDRVVAYQERKIRSTNPWITKWYEDWESLVTAEDSDCLLQQ